MSGWKAISCRCLVLGLTLSELAVSLNLAPFQSSCFRCSSQNPRSYPWALFLAHPLHSIGHKVPLTLPAKHCCVSCRNAWQRSRMEAQFSSDTCERKRGGKRRVRGALDWDADMTTAPLVQQWPWSKGCLLEKSHFEPNGQEPSMPLGFSLSLVFHCWGLPRWLSGKESSCQFRRCGFSSWVRKIPQRRKWQPTPVFLPGKSHGERSLVGYSSWGCQESDTNEWLTLLFRKNWRCRGSWVVSWLPPAAGPQDSLQPFSPGHTLAQQPLVVVV